MGWSTRSGLLAALSVLGLVACEDVIGLNHLTDSYTGPGSSSSGGSSGGAAPSCLDSSLDSTGFPGCSACVESACAAQASAAESGCTNLISCLCPSGTYEAGNAPQCASLAEEPSCQSASSTLSTCESESCATACGMTTGGSGCTIPDGTYTVSSATATGGSDCETGSATLTWPPTAEASDGGVVADSCSTPTTNGSSCETTCTLPGGAPAFTMTYTQTSGGFSGTVVDAPEVGEDGGAFTCSFTFTATLN